jgi:hypothetical protein
MSQIVIVNLHAHWHFLHLDTLMHHSWSHLGEAFRSPSDLASIAYFSEGKIEVLAIPADPVPDPLRQWLFHLLELHLLLLAAHEGLIDVRILHVLILFIA